jgi:hypothetical protein
VAAAATLAVPLAPASAATCGGDAGVSVVVDFHQLGGGVRTACDSSGGGEDAAKLFTASGFSITYAQRQPGFVCRVNGAPASDPCVNTPPSDAYWSLWWSDGTSGTWKYSSLGVGSLTVPAGGYVALSWQAGSGQAPPGVKPAAHPASPTSAPTTRPSPTRTPTVSAPSTATTTPVASSPTGSPVATPLHPTKTPTAGHTQGHGPPPVPVDSPSASPTPGVGTETNRDSSGGGLPGWLAPALIALLFVAAGAVAVVRRNRTGGR